MQNPLTMLMRTEPRPYQLEDLDWIKDKKEFALLYEMGLGKSKVTIDNVCYLYQQGLVETVFIIIKQSALSVWYNYDSEREEETGEIVKHIWRGVPWKAHILGSLTTKKEKNKIWSMVRDKGLKFIIINTEAFQSRTKTTADRFKMLRTLIPVDSKDMVVIDEATDIKTPDSNRTKFITEFFEPVPWKRILTGTAVAERPEDCYSLYRFLRKTFWKFPNFFAFKNYFCVFREVHLPTHVFKKRVGYQNLDKLKAFILDRNIAIRRTQAEVLKDLPPASEKIYITQLSDEQKKLYKTMKNLLFAELLGDTLELTTAMHKYMKLHQITGGVLHMEDEPKIIPGKNEKLELTIDLIRENLPNKAIVFSLAKSKAMVNMVADRLAKEFGEEAVVKYTGDTELDERADIIKQFQDPKSPVKIFVANDTASRAVTLTEANLQIYYSLSYSSDIMEQSKKRAHRIGQKRFLQIVYLLAEDSEDFRIKEALEAKKNIIDYLLDNLRN